MKKHKIYLFIAGLSCLVLCVQAQSRRSVDDGKARLALSIWIPDRIEGLPDEAKQNLHDKLSQIITRQGLSADPGQSRFVFTANVVMQDKKILPSAPPKHLYKMDITFYIGDGFEGKVYSSYSTSVTGVGESEIRAYINAIKNISVNHPGYQSFIDQGKSRIIDYYNSQCDILIKQAQTLSGRHEYDEALWVLTSIPDVCRECWEKSMAVAADVFKHKIDSECKSLILEATGVWNAGQSWDAAENAGAILSQIDPDATCYQDALALSRKIATRIREVDQREWAFKYDQEIGLKRDLIKAYRDVGVAWGQGQPRTVVYRYLW
ncbi:MAG: hypothetical protein LBB90_12060 [Tannerella sp.]|jgi:hypothetical protein|nr:hypothetical protein [Tannerella sp.]